jgi:hypothetical protein
MRKYMSWLGFLLIIVALVVVGFWSAGLLRGLAQGVSGLGEKISTQVGQLIHPTPTIIPDPVTIVREVRSLARLETIHYTVEKVITGETRQGTFAFLFGDRMLFVAHGVVVAGVDLGKMEQQDVWDDAMGTLYVNLPDAEIFISTLDNEKSHVYDRETGIFTHGDIHLESTVRQAAEDEIERAALEDGILEQARVNAESYLLRLLRSFGYAEVIFVDETAPPTPTATHTPIPTATSTPSE